MLQEEFSIATKGRGLHDVTARIAAIVGRAGIETGLCHVFLKHTSASLLLTENADPDVHRDLEAFMGRLVPDGARYFRHDAEGPDDMAAHVRTLLAGSSLTLPVRASRCALGTWQGVYLWEHRTTPHERHVIVTVAGGRD